MRYANPRNGVMKQKLWKGHLYRLNMSKVYYFRNTQWVKTTRFCKLEEEKRYMPLQKKSAV